MKKINNRGFTLIELLAVLVILITILTIAIPSITSSVERNKKNMLDKKINIIETAAEAYVELYKNSFDYNKFSMGNCCINIDDLISKNILKDSDILDADNEKIKGAICLVNDGVAIDYKYYSLSESKGNC